MVIAGSKVHSSEQEAAYNRDLKLSTAQTPLPDEPRDELAPVECDVQSAACKRSRPVDLSSEPQQRTPKGPESEGKIDESACVVSRPVDTIDKSLCLQDPSAQDRAYMGEEEGGLADQTASEESPIKDKHPGSAHKSALLKAREVLALEQRFVKPRGAGLEATTAEASPEDDYPDTIDLIDESRRIDAFPVCDSEGLDVSNGDQSSTRAAPQFPQPNSQDSISVSSELLRTMTDIRTAAEEVPAGLRLAPEVSRSQGPKQQIEYFLRHASQGLQNAHMAEDFSQERLNAPLSVNVVPGKTHRWLREGAPPWRIKRIDIRKEYVGRGLQSEQVMGKKREREDDDDHILNSRQRKRSIRDATIEEHEAMYRPKGTPGKQRKLHSWWGKGTGFGLDLKKWMASCWQEMSDGPVNS